MKFLKKRSLCFALAAVLCILPFSCAFAEDPAVAADEKYEAILWYGSLSGEISGNFSRNDPVTIVFEDLGNEGEACIYDADKPDNQLLRLEYALNQNDEIGSTLAYNMLRNMEDGVQSEKIALTYRANADQQAVSMWACTVNKDANAPAISIVVRKPGLDSSMLLSSGNVPAGISAIKGHGAEGSAVCAEVRGKAAGEVVIGESESFILPLKHPLKTGDSVVLTYKNENGEMLPFRDEYEVSERAELSVNYLYDDATGLASLNFTGEAGQGVMFTLRAEDDTKNAVPARKITLDESTCSYRIPKDVLEPETRYCVEFSYEGASEKPEVFSFDSPVKAVPEVITVVEEVDLIRPVITDVIASADDPMVITGVCSEKNAEITLRYAGEADAAPIEKAVSGEDGSFRFESAKWLESDKTMEIIAVDAAMNESEPYTVPTIIFVPSEEPADIEEETEDEEVSVKPIAIEVKLDPSVTDDLDKIILSISAESEKYVLLSIIEDNSGSPVESRVRTDENGLCVIPKNDKMIKDGHSYAIKAVYEDPELRSQVEETVFEFYHDESAPVITDIPLEISKGTTEIPGKVSEPATVYLTENGQEIKSFEVAEVGGQFSFSGLALNPESAYAVYAVDTCRNIGGPIDLKFKNDPIIIGSVEIEHADGEIQANRPQKVKCWVLSEEALQNVSLLMDDTVIPGAVLASDDMLLGILSNNPEYSALGEFVYCASFEGEVDFSGAEPGEHMIRIERVDVNGKTQIIQDVKHPNGLKISIVKSSADFGKFAFVLALLVLALVACIAVIIIIGRRIKFLQGASLDASNESNLTARYKSQL